MLVLWKISVYLPEGRHPIIPIAERSGAKLRFSAAVDKSMNQLL